MDTWPADARAFSRPTHLQGKSPGNEVEFLSPVSEAWTSLKYCYSPLDGMLAYRRILSVANKKRFPWAFLGMDNSSVYIINRIIHGRLEIWNLSSRVHIWYLTRSLRSLVRYQCEHSKINSISPRAHVLFSISFSGAYKVIVFRLMPGQRLWK